MFVKEFIFSSLLLAFTGMLMIVGMVLLLDGLRRFADVVGIPVSVPAGRTRTAQLGLDDRYLYLPDHTRNMGTVIQAGRGSGKSRFMGSVTDGTGLPNRLHRRNHQDRGSTCKSA
jgi:hypothetical protein